jgi:hypothetical protein
MFPSAYRASKEEQTQAMSADALVPNPIFTETRAITIRAPAARVWPWLAQMGSGRAGWYAYDWVDNGGHPSARSILPEYQQIGAGDILPALPGMKDVFLVTAAEPPGRLVLTVPDAAFGNRVSWEFLLKPLERGHTRLIVRGRVSSHWLAAAAQDDSTAHHKPIFIERVYGLLAHLPVPIMLGIASFGHGLMHVRQLRGIQTRAEA